MAAVTERSLAPEINIVDILDDILWSRSGDLTLVYRIDAFHEPGLDDPDFDAAALLAENCWSGMPEGTFYQFYVFVDQRSGVRRLEQALPPIAGDDRKERLFEEFRRARFQELTRVEQNGNAANLVQVRRHFLCATFRPVAAKAAPFDNVVRDMVERIKGWIGRPVSPRTDGRWETTYESLIEEAGRFARRVEVGLSQMGLGFERCRTPEIVRLAYELLNPTAIATIDVDSLSERARCERDGLPRSIVDEFPYAGDTSPVCSLLNDDLLTRRDHLRLGDRFVCVISLKELPSSVRMGRKEGMSVIGRSQVIEDFVQSPYGAAIVGNSSTKLVGQPGGESVEDLRTHLRLTGRQVEQVRRLSRTPRYHEFLLIQGDRSNVVRVPADPFSKWVFTTSPKDRERFDRLAAERPDLSLLDKVRLLASEG